MKKYYPLLFFVAMLLIFDLTYSLLSTCQATYPAATGHNDYEKTCTMLGGWVPWGAGFALRPLDTFLETYEHSLTVAFTVVLAVSTVLLWRVTQRSVVIAERALTHLEAPFLSIEITENGIARSYSDTGHTFQTLRFAIANYGRTPARLIEVADKLALVEHNEGLPSEVNPGYANRISIPHGVIAPPQGKSEGWSQNLFAFTLQHSIEGVQPLKQNKIFFYGFVRYATIFDEVFRVGFCFMFDIMSEKWILTGGDRHNYHRKETEFYPPPLF